MAKGSSWGGQRSVYSVRGQPQVQCAWAAFIGNTSARAVHMAVSRRQWSTPHLIILGQVVDKRHGVRLHRELRGRQEKAAVSVAELRCDLLGQRQLKKKRRRGRGAAGGRCVG